MGNLIVVESKHMLDAIAADDAQGAVGALKTHPALSHKRMGVDLRTIYHACALGGQVAVLRCLCDHVWRTMPDEHGQVHEFPPEAGKIHPVIKPAINKYDSAGLTPLMVACKHGHVSTVELLLAQGADPWAGDRLMGRSALHHAARANQAECIEAILASPYVPQVGKLRKAVYKLVDIPSSAGYTPLHYAATSHAAEAAAALFRHGADPNAKTWVMGGDFIQLDPGSTPLHSAARYANLDMAMVLLKYWHDNLKPHEVTDPRVVENSVRQKPYQLRGVRANAPLARVLDPGTPIKQICDPFGTVEGVEGKGAVGSILAEAILVPPSKALPLRVQRCSAVSAEYLQVSEASKLVVGNGRCLSDPTVTMRGEAAPCPDELSAGPRPQNPGGSEEGGGGAGAVVKRPGEFSLPSLPQWHVGATPRRAEVVTDSVCAKVADGWGGKSPAGTPREGCAKAAGLRGQGGSAPDLIGVHWPSTVDRTPSVPTCAAAGAAHAQGGCGGEAARSCAQPVAAASHSGYGDSPAPTRPGTGASAGASVASTPSAATGSRKPSSLVLQRLPTPTLPPVTLFTTVPGCESSMKLAPVVTAHPGHAAVAAAVTEAPAGARTLSGQPSDASATMFTSMFAAFSSVSGGESSVTGMSPPAKPPSPEGERPTGRSIMKSMSRKLSAMLSGSNNNIAASASAASLSRNGSNALPAGCGPAAAAAGDTAAVRGSSSRDGFTSLNGGGGSTSGMTLQRSGSCKGGSPRGSATVLAAWGEPPAPSAATAAAAAPSRKSKAPALETVPDFTRDSHAEDALPVQITMYPYFRADVERLRIGDTCDQVRRPSEASTAAVAEETNAWNERRSAAVAAVGATGLHVSGMGAAWAASQPAGGVSCVGGAAHGGMGGGDASPRASPRCAGVRLSRRGMVPTNDLSEDESRMEEPGRWGALSPQATRRGSAQVLRLN